jgi:uncharacterized membrane protein
MADGGYHPLMFPTADLPLIVSRWFHLAAVIVAIGGTVFARLVLHHAARLSLPEREHSALITAIVARWSRVLHICIAIILLTGIYNAVVMLGRHQGQPVYHSLLGVKILLALILFFFAIAITGRSPAFAGLREHRAKWMTVNIVLAGVIVLLSNVLKFLPWS